MDRIFAEYGVPEVVKSDKGLPFNRGDFNQFANTLGFGFRKINAFLPQPYSELERFMQTLKKNNRCSKNGGLIVERTTLYIFAYEWRIDRRKKNYVNFYVLFTHKLR